MSVYFSSDDGWQDFGVAVSITWTQRHDDGTETTWPGTCPQCQTTPLNGEPYICEHGVTLGNAVPGPLITSIDPPNSVTE